MRLTTRVYGIGNFTYLYSIVLGMRVKHIVNWVWLVNMLTTMAERQQRQRLRALRNDRNLARFVVEGKATGKQLGTGSYGSVEEVCKI